MGIEPIDILAKALILLGFFLSVSIFVSIYTQKRRHPGIIQSTAPQEYNRHDTDASVPPISIKTDADRLHALRLSASAGKFAFRADRKISVCLAMDLIV